MTARFVVTGTDTGIGKTVFAAALAGALGAVYWKPVQTGPDSDSDTVRPPRPALRCCRKPIASSWLPRRITPPRRKASRIDPASLTPPDGDLVIEGAGGLMVPLTRDTLYVDVFARWGLPLVLCARTTLGTINHSLLSIAAIKARRIPLLGVVFIGGYNEDSEATICEMGKAQRLGRLPLLDPLTPDSLRAAFAKNFAPEEFA